MIRSPAGFDGGDRIKRYLDYYQPSYGVMMLSAGQFSPASLFAAGEQGAWYDPSDFSTMFQESTGVTPVTAVEQPVGLILDKSKGLVLGSELVSNPGPFTATTGWTAATGSALSVSGGNLVVTVTAGFTTFPPGRFTFATEVGKTYRFTATWKAGSAGYNAALNARRTGSTSYNINLSNTTTSFVTRSFVIVAATTSTDIEFFEFKNPTDGGTIEIQSVSVKELAGNHASQATSTSRPVLSARVNLLTYSEQFNNAAWVKSNAGVGVVPTVTANHAAAPDGTTTAERAQFSLGGGTSGGDLSMLRQGVVTSGTVTYTFSFWAKSTDGTSSYEMSVYGLI
jgi:hypothetical protein